MTEDSPEVERVLSGVDESKRRTLIRLLRAAFVVPVVASFSMDGLAISEVHAHDSDHPNSTMHPNSTDKHKKKDKKHKNDHDDDKHKHDHDDDKHKHDHDDDKKHKKHKHDHDDD
jgi:hypothetical protein